MRSSNMEVASGGAVRACLYTKDVPKFLELYRSFGFKPSDDEMAEFVLLLALDSDVQLRGDFDRSFPYFTVSEEGGIIRKLCKHCEENEGVDCDYLLTFALRYATNRTGANAAIEDLLAMAIEKRVNCFSKVKGYLGRRFSEAEINKIVSIASEKGDPEILIEILPDAAAATRNLIVKYFADAGMPRMMKRALDAIGWNATVDEIDRLATAIRFGD